MEETIKVATELIAQVGVPGAVLILGIWKLAPVGVKLLEVLTRMEDSLREMKDEMRDLNARLAKAV